MERINRIAREIGRGALTALTWILFAIVLRPMFLIAQLFILIIEFIFDVITFPIEFTKTMNKEE